MFFRPFSIAILVSIPLLLAECQYHADCPAALNETVRILKKSLATFPDATVPPHTFRQLVVAAKIVRRIIRRINRHSPLAGKPLALKRDWERVRALLRNLDCARSEAGEYLYCAVLWYFEDIDREDCFGADPIFFEDSCFITPECETTLASIAAFEYDCDIAPEEEEKRLAVLSAAKEALESITQFLPALAGVRAELGGVLAAFDAWRNAGFASAAEATEAKRRLHKAQLTSRNTEFARSVRRTRLLVDQLVRTTCRFSDDACAKQCRKRRSLAVRDCWRAAKVCRPQRCISAPVTTFKCAAATPEPYACPNQCWGHKKLAFRDCMDIGRDDLGCVLLPCAEGRWACSEKQCPYVEYRVAGSGVKGRISLLRAKWQAKRDCRLAAKLGVACEVDRTAAGFRCAVAL